MTKEAGLHLEDKRSKIRRTGLPRPALCFRISHFAADRSKGSKIDTVRTVRSLSEQSEMKGP